MKTWLITGCSSGFGRSIALAVLESGDRVIVTSRRVSDVEDIAATAPDRALALALDVTDPEQIREVVARATDHFGGIDVLVNNAGYGYRGAVEEGEDEEVRAIFETHVFGPLNLIKEVLPQMRARRSGTIVSMSSVGAQAMMPGSSFYNATKLALEGITGTLRNEVEPLGITAFSVAPGFFRTDFAGRSLRGTSVLIEDYIPTTASRRKENDTMHGHQIGDPEKAARVVIDVVNDGNAPEILLLGSDAVQYYGMILEKNLDTMRKWEAISTSTDFDS